MTNFTQTKKDKKRTSIKGIQKKMVIIAGFASSVRCVWLKAPVPFHKKKSRRGWRCKLINLFHVQKVTQGRNVTKCYNQLNLHSTSGHRKPVYVCGISVVCKLCWWCFCDQNFHFLLNFFIATLFAHEINRMNSFFYSYVSLQAIFIIK